MHTFFDEGTVSGNHIMAIVPDHQQEMGWGRDYDLTGEDYEHIGSKAVREHRDLLESRQSGDSKSTWNPK